MSNFPHPRPPGSKRITSAEEVVWRCARCGKWSHARRRPKTHKRFTTSTPADGDVVLERVLAEYDHLNGFTSTGGWFVECGPFEQWTARRSA